MKKKIILFTTNFPYGRGETFLETEILFLSEKAYVTIIPLFTKGELRKIPENIEVRSPLISFDPKSKKKLIKSGLFNFSPLFFSFSEFCKKKVILSKTKIWNFLTSLLLFRSIYKNFNLQISDTDILYFYWADKSALILPFIRKKSKAKSFVRFHGSDLYEEAKGGYIPFRKLTFSAMDVACPTSENGASYLQEKYPEIIPKALVVSRLGVLKKGDNPRIGRGKFHLLSCSNVIPLKRVDLIAKALNHLKLEIKWTHIGDGSEFEKLKEITKSLAQNIEVRLTGAIPNSDVIKLYSKEPVDLLINVSETEGIPVSMMEALSFGIPIMATNVGGVAEIVDEKVGVLLEKNISETELATKILEYIKSADKISLRSNAVKIWNKKFNAKNNYTKFAKILTNK